MNVEWLSDVILWTADTLGTEVFIVKGLIAVMLVCSMCGMLGSMVVGNRMAFFSDAMAHCAFAGVSLGYLSVLLGGGNRDMATWVVPVVMVGFGIAVGAAMVWVRDQ